MPQEMWDRIEAARGEVPRAAWFKNRMLEILDRSDEGRGELGASLEASEVVLQRSAVPRAPKVNSVPASFGFKSCSRGCRVPATTEIKRCVQHGLPLKEA